MNTLLFIVFIYLCGWICGHRQARNFSIARVPKRLNPLQQKTTTTTYTCWKGLIGALSSLLLIGCAQVSHLAGERPAAYALPKSAVPLELIAHTAFDDNVRTSGLAARQDEDVVFKPGIASLLPPRS